MRYPSPARLTPLTSFGANPGKLLAHVHIPDDLAPGAPLVVVLHGCTQSAADYDRGSGWSRLADEQGFALLYPEQQRANNPNLCFNWFRPGDARRGRGEAASIRQMITHLVSGNALDEHRIFVTGLSAGGAMTSVMLASYPEVFAGGAVIAGLPFATANSVPEALDRMRGSGMPGRAELGALVSNASRYTGPWPRLSVWHGSADGTVALTNAAAVVDQWTALHGLPASPTASDTLDGQRRDFWRDSSGRELIERITVSGLGHGTPLATTGSDANGTPGPHMLEARINSTRHIARFFGILGTAGAKSEPLRPAPPSREPAAPSRRAPLPILARRLPLPPQVAGPKLAGPKLAGIAEVIDKALRSAGLLR